ATSTPHSLSLHDALPISAGPARHCRADRARNADADVLRVQHAERGFAVRPRDRELIHLFVIALLQINDLALRRAADQNHGKAVRSEEHTSELQSLAYLVC